MPQSVRAVYEDGVLRPLDRLRGIAEHGEVRLIVRDAAGSPQSRAERLGGLPTEDAEEVVRAIEEELENADPGRPDRGPGERETIKQLASFLRLVACLTDLDELKPGWNTYDAEAPGATALKTSLRILRVLYSLSSLPDKVHHVEPAPRPEVGERPAPACRRPLAAVLASYHVRYRPGMLAHLRRLAAEGAGGLDVEPILDRYAFFAELRVCE